MTMNDKKGVIMEKKNQITINRKSLIDASFLAIWRRQKASNLAPHYFFYGLLLFTLARDFNQPHHQRRCEQRQQRNDDNKTADAVTKQKQT